MDESTTPTPAPAPTPSATPGGAAPGTVPPPAARSLTRRVDGGGGVGGEPPRGRGRPRGSAKRPGAEPPATTPPAPAAPVPAVGWTDAAARRLLDRLCLIGKKQGIAEWDLDADERELAAPLLVAHLNGLLPAGPEKSESGAGLLVLALVLGPALFATGEKIWDRVQARRRGAAPPPVVTERPGGKPPPKPEPEPPAGKEDGHVLRPV